MSLQHTIMIKDINALYDIIQIDKSTLIPDHRRIGRSIEKLTKIGALVHKRAIVCNTFQPGIELIVYPDIIVIGKTDGFCLKDILFSQIDHVDHIEETIQLDDGCELRVIDQDLQRIGSIDRCDLAITADIVEDGQRVAIGTQLFQLVVLCQHIDIPKIVYREVKQIDGPYRPGQLKGGNTPTRSGRDRTGLTQCRRLLRRELAARIGLDLRK